MGLFAFPEGHVMALDATKVRVAVTGVMYAGPTATAAPTGTASVLAVGFVDLGYIGEGGVTQSMPGGGDATPIKAWQNGATVRTIRTASEDVPTFSAILLETKLATVELYVGSTVTQAVSEGSYSFDSTALRPRKSFVLDVIDAAELIRVYAPYGIVTEVGDLVYANAEPIGYEVTIAADRDPVLGYNFRSWATALKT